MPSVGSFQHPSPQVPPRRINALHVPQMRRDGAAPGVVAPHGRGRDSVQIKFAGAPTPLPGFHSGVCHWFVIQHFHRVSPKPVWNPGRGCPGQSSPQLSTVRIRRNQS